MTVTKMGSRPNISKPGSAIQNTSMRRFIQTQRRDLPSGSCKNCSTSRPIKSSRSRWMAAPNSWPILKLSARTWPYLSTYCHPRGQPIMAALLGHVNMPCQAMVERGNRTFREEFYACRDLLADSIGAIRFELKKAVEKYNSYRPHYALKGKTPLEYLQIIQTEAT